MTRWSWPCEDGRREYVRDSYRDFRGPGIVRRVVNVQLECVMGV